jgi:hypothetical protein
LSDAREKVSRRGTPRLGGNVPVAD